MAATSIVTSHHQLFTTMHSYALATCLTHTHVLSHGKAQSTMLSARQCLQCAAFRSSYAAALTTGVEGCIPPRPVLAAARLAGHPDAAATSATCAAHPKVRPSARGASISSSEREAARRAVRRSPEEPTSPPAVPLTICRVARQDNQHRCMG